MPTASPRSLTGKRKPTFSVNQDLPENADYVIVDRETQRRSGEARPLGVGSAGVTCRARYKSCIERAIKFLSPEKGGDEQAELSFTALEKEFKKEIQLLISLTHTNIAKIVDFGAAEIEGVRYHYFVTEYIEGKKFEDYWKDCSGTDFLEILRQVADALEYLHVNNCFHMDVKEENIFVQAKGGRRPHGILLDLGGAKLFDDDSERLETVQTRYISTDKATRTERRAKLGKLVTYAQIWKWNVDLDLYAFGALIKRALQSQHLRDALGKELGESGSRALVWIVERLTEGGGDDVMESRYYKNATQLREDLRRLSPEHAWPIGLPELSLVVGPASVQLPSQRIGLTPELLEVVNHPFFQRLRDIPQLEYINLIYPGATHSRFEHALSTFQIARMFLSKLLGYPEVRMLAQPQYVRAGLLVALLHDVGHYPLSHMFEDFTEKRRAGEDQILSDDALFESFICQDAESDPFREVIEDELKNLRVKETLAHLVRRLFPDSYPLLHDLMYPSPQGFAPTGILRGIINSAIDADKLAYLADDSSATGVQFGRGIDLYGLIDALVPPRGNDARRAVIGIREEGLAAAESVVLSRFWMISRVYWHRTNRAVMAMHKLVVAHLLKKGCFSFLDYFRQTLSGSQPSATRLLADWYAKTWPEPERSEVRNPLTGLIGGGRDIYDRLLTISASGTHEAGDELLYKHIVAEKATALLDLGEEIRGHLCRKFPNVKLMYGDVAVDGPYKPRDELGYNVLVYLDRAPEEGRWLSGSDSVSPMLRSLKDDFEQNVKKCRIFLHPAAVDTLRALGVTEKAKAAVREFLADRYGLPR